MSVAHYYLPQSVVAETALFGHGKVRDVYFSFSTATMLKIMFMYNIHVIVDITCICLVILYMSFDSQFSLNKNHVLFRTKYIPYSYALKKKLGN